MKVEINKQKQYSEPKTENLPLGKFWTWKSRTETNFSVLSSPDKKLIIKDECDSKFLGFPKIWAKQKMGFIDGKIKSFQAL